MIQMYEPTSTQNTDSSVLIVNFLTCSFSNQESLADAERSAERTLQIAVMRTSAGEVAGEADGERNRGGHRDIEVIHLQGISISPFPGLVNFVPAVSYPFYLNLPAAFSQPGNGLIEIPC